MSERVGFFGAYASMWKKIFDYKSKSSRREYWFPFIIQSVLATAAIVLFIIADIQYSDNLPYLIPAYVITAYLGVSLIPWVSLTVRRLHDAGKKGWWTFLMLIVGVGTFILLLICSLSSSPDFYNPFQDRPEVVYGPPEWFDPEYNGPEEVYGPPEWFGADPEPSDDPYDPDANNPETVYGPPEWFDPENNEPEEVYGPPEWFDDYNPEENIEPPVYGPPEGDPGEPVSPITGQEQP